MQQAHLFQRPQLVDIKSQNFFFICEFFKLMKNISFSLNAVKNFICTFPPFFHLNQYKLVFASVVSFKKRIYYHIILYLTFFYFFLSAQQTEPGSLLTGPAAPEPFSNNNEKKPFKKSS